MAPVIIVAISCVIAYYSYYQPIYPEEYGYVIPSTAPENSELWEDFIKQRYTYDPKRFQGDPYNCILLRIIWPDVTSPTPFNVGWSPGYVIKFYVVVSLPKRIETNEIEVCCFILDAANRVRGRFMVTFRNVTDDWSPIKCFKALFYFFLPEDMIGRDVILYVEVFNAQLSPLAIKTYSIRTVAFQERLSAYIGLGSLVSAVLTPIFSAIVGSSKLAGFIAWILHKVRRRKVIQYD